MSMNKVNANDYIDSKSDGGILNSDLMKVLEDIDSSL